jgi:hypothetical protein
MIVEVMHKIKFLLLFIMAFNFSFAQKGDVAVKIDTTLFKNFDVNKQINSPAYQGSDIKIFNKKIKKILYPKEKGYRADYILYRKKLYSKKDIPNILDTIKVKKYEIEFDSITKKTTLIIIEIP